MKPSHLTTPRCMEKCHFDLDADPIERPEVHHRHDVIVMRACAIAAIALAIILWVI